jgi:hypothetical protein
MAEVVIGRCHGGWEPKDGYTKVPAGSTLYLFVDPMRAMWADQGLSAVLQSTNELIQMQSRAREKIEQYTTIANYRTYDIGMDEEARKEMPEGPLQQGVEIVQGGSTLEEVLAQYPSSNFYWFACQVNNLNQTGVDIGQGQGQDMQ